MIPRPRRGPYRPEAPLRLVKSSPWVPEPPKVRSKFAYAQAELVDGVEPWPDRAGLPMRWTVTHEGESHIVTKGARGLRCSCGGHEAAACYHIGLVGRLETSSPRKVSNGR